MTAENFFAAIGMGFCGTLAVLFLLGLATYLRGNLTGRSPLRNLFCCMDENETEERQEYR